MTTILHPASEDPIRNERFRLGIEGAGIGVWDLDLATQQLLWSRTTRALFGVADDLPLTYELFLSLLDPHEREQTRQAVARSVATGCGFDMQYRVNNDRSRSSHWVRARGSVVRGDQGGPGHLSGIVVDIDDQKQIEEALRTRESHLHSILETIPDAMIVIDGRGIIQFYSSAAERQFGYTESEAIGRNVSILMPNPDRSRHDGYIARYRSAGSIVFVTRIFHARERR